MAAEDNDCDDDYHTQRWVTSPIACIAAHSHLYLCENVSFFFIFVP